MANTQLVDLVSLNTIYTNLISNLDDRGSSIKKAYEDADTTVKNELNDRIDNTNDAVSDLNEATVKLAGTQTISATNTFTGTNTFSGTGNKFTTAVTFSGANTFTGVNTFKTGKNTFNSGVEFGIDSDVSFKNIKASESTTTGAVTIFGGLGVGGSVYANILHAEDSISTDGELTSDSVSTTDITADTIYAKTINIRNTSTTPETSQSIQDVINDLINKKMVNTFNYCGQYETFAKLKEAVKNKTITPKVGDVYNISDSDATYKKHNFVWSNDSTIEEDNEGWDDLGDSQVDFTNFETKIKKYLNGSNTETGAENYTGSTKITTLGDVSSKTTFGKNCTWNGNTIGKSYHYSPSEETDSAISVDASSDTSATWDTTSLVTGVDIKRDSNGHVTGLSLDSIKMPAEPTKEDLGLGDVENTKLSTWVGTENITTVGTITTGTWNGTEIAYDYHYTPTASETLSAVATSTESASWADTSAVTAVSLQRDGKGHVTGLSLTSKKFRFDDISTDVAFTSTTESNATNEGAVTISGGLGVTGNIYGSAVYNAVWNDIADCIEVDCELTAGYCYSFDGEHYYRTNEYLDGGCIGIHSDTAGMHVGSKGGNEMEVAIGGFVLAYVDKEYKVGTPLTCTEGGMLTEIKLEDKRDYPERIIATYWKNEPAEEWGSETRKVKVNGRKWVKIK